MPLPRFRFIESAPSPMADAQFWRDVEASERLGSRFRANLFLRDLCRNRARACTAPGLDAPEAERHLLRDVQARGFRVFGPDLEAAEAPRTRVG